MKCLDYNYYFYVNLVICCDWYNMYLQPSGSVSFFLFCHSVLFLHAFAKVVLKFKTKAYTSFLRAT